MNTLKKTWKRSFSRLAGASALAASLALPSLALAAVPLKVTHQGRLYDTAGMAVNDTLPVTFTIYDDLDAPVWTETHTVTFAEGYYAVELGSLTPLDVDLLATVGSLELGVKIANDAELSPRSAINSVPYALVASDAVGDVHPTTVSVGGQLVIDANGQWVGDPTGLVGATGAVGPTGPAGLAGPFGPPGANGAVGPTGPTGPAGANGAVGPAGPAGAVGPAGPAGAAGIKGATGATGATGAAGANGAAGPAGPAGAVGPTGPAGANGANGAVGPTGPAGAAGAAGAVGPVGPTGPAGAAGAMGIKGATGATGIIATASFAGIVGSIAGGSAAYVFAGPPAAVTVAASQRLTGSATAAMGLPVGAAAQVARVGLCYQPAAGGALVNFVGGAYINHRFVAADRRNYSADGSVLPAAGNYNVGLCVLNSGAAAISDNDFVNGWVQVTSDPGIIQ